MKKTETVHLRKQIIQDMFKRLSKEAVNEFEKDFGPILEKELINNFPMKYSSRPLFLEPSLQINDEYFNNLMNASVFREMVINLQGYVMVTSEFCKALANFIGKESKVLEIMSGSGALAYGLRKEGIEVIATDNFSLFNESSLWTNVENIDAIAAIKKYVTEVDYLLVSWPPYQNSIIDQVLEAVANINPNIYIIHIGEINGCTGTETMWDRLTAIEDTRFEEVYNTYRTWDMLYDVPGLYKVF